MSADRFSGDSRTMTAIITTSLAATFNLLVMLLICFWVVPLINDATVETKRNREVIEANHKILERNTGELHEQELTIRHIGKQLEEMTKRLSKEKKER